MAIPDYDDVEQMAAIGQIRHHHYVKVVSEGASSVSSADLKPGSFVLSRRWGLGLITGRHGPDSFRVVFKNRPREEICPKVSLTASNGEGEAEREALRTQAQRLQIGQDDFWNDSEPEDTCNKCGKPVRLVRDGDKFRVFDVYRDIAGVIGEHDCSGPSDKNPVLSNNSIGMRRHTQQQHRPRGSAETF